MTDNGTVSNKWGARTENTQFAMAAVSSPTISKCSHEVFP